MSKNLNHSFDKYFQYKNRIIYYLDFEEEQRIFGNKFVETNNNKIDLIFIYFKINFFKCII